jgi:hypothetical protein
MTGHEKTRYTVVLSCRVNGKNNPIVILKRETSFLLEFLLTCEKGWMDEEGIKLWLHMCGGMR